MKNKSKRTSGLLAFVALAVALLTPATALAAPQDTFVTFSGEGGDYITLDRTWSYNRSNATIVTTASPDNNHIQVQISGNTWWFMDFAAPAGQALAVGSYQGATRYPFQAPGNPGLSLFGDGRGCNTVTGSFEVLEASFGPFGWVERFHATFEQHCEGSTTSRSFGEILIDNGAAPAPLTMQVNINPGGVTKIGRVLITGSVTCSKPTFVSLIGTLTQRVNRLNVTSGSWNLSVPCGTEPTTWFAEVRPEPGLAPFNPGKAQADTFVQGFDSDYGRFVSQDYSTVISLKPSK
jgi:hypothetical protein